MLRALWPELVRAELLTTAYALDSVLVEVAFVVGPLLVALAAALVRAGARAAGRRGRWCSSGTFVVHGDRARAALLAGLAGPRDRRACWARSRPGRAHDRHQHRADRLLPRRRRGRVPGVRRGARRPALAGPLIAALVTGQRRRRADVRRLGHRVTTPQHATCCGARAAAARDAAAGARGSFAVMVPLRAAGGTRGRAAASPPATSSIGDVAPRGAPTEAFTWLITALVAGDRAGNAASGAIVETDDWSAAFVAAALVGLLGFAIVLHQAPVAGSRPPATARLRRRECQRSRAPAPAAPWPTRACGPTSQKASRDPVLAAVAHEQRRGGRRAARRSTASTRAELARAARPCIAGVGRPVRALDDPGHDVLQPAEDGVPLTRGLDARKPSSGIDRAHRTSCTRLSLTARTLARGAGRLDRRRHSDRPTSPPCGAPRVSDVAHGRWPMTTAEDHRPRGRRDRPGAARAGAARARPRASLGSPIELERFDLSLEQPPRDRRTRSSRGRAGDARVPASGSRRPRSRPRAPTTSARPTASCARRSTARSSSAPAGASPA